jgi:flagellar biosynthesis GTPase FlhF
MLHIINTHLEKEKNNTDHKVELIENYKPYKPFRFEKFDRFVMKEFDLPYVSTGLNFQEFEEHNTIVMESCTGTGKTTATAKYFQQLCTKDKSLRIFLQNQFSISTCELF